MAQRAAVDDTWVECRCAYCDGMGRDPFRVLPPLSNCGVCGGKGTVRIKEPFETCPACRGTGVYYRSRVSCRTCGGKGVVTVKREGET